MIKHIVMWQLRSDIESKSKSIITNELTELLMGMKGHIPQLKEIQVYKNIESDISNYDLVLEADFENFDDLKSYIIHPIHQNIFPIVKSYTLNRACVDYQY